MCYLFSVTAVICFQHTGHWSVLNTRRSTPLLFSPSRVSGCSLRSVPTAPYKLQPFSLHCGYLIIKPCLSC